MQAMPMTLTPEQRKRHISFDCDVFQAMELNPEDKKDWAMAKDLRKRIDSHGKRIVQVNIFMFVKKIIFNGSCPIK